MEQRLSRRQTLAVLASSAAAVSMLAACGTTTSAPTNTPGASASTTTSNGVAPTKAAASQTASTAAASAATTSSGASTFAFAFAFATKVIDPHAPSDNPTLVAQIPMYEGLLSYKVGTFEIEPVLAASWQVSSDGLQYTFKIRQGVKFHDGTVLDAPGVKKSFDRMLTVGKAPNAAVKPYLDSTEAPDASTFVVKLKSSYAPALTIIGSTYIVSPKVLDEHGGSDNAQAWLNEHEAGTGPYTLKSWDRDQSMTLTKFAEYWRGWPGKHFDTVIIRTVVEPATQRQLVQRGEVQMASTIAANDLAQLKSDANLQVYSSVSAREFLIRLDNSRPPFNDKNFRQGVIAAFDYKGAVDQVLGGGGAIAAGYVPTIYRTHDATLAPETMDLAKAKQLLDASSTPKGASFSCTYIANYDSQQQTAQIWQANLSKLGVTVKLNPLPFATIVDRSAKPETRDNAAYLAFNYGGIDETFNQWQTLSSKTNAAWGTYGYKNDQIDGLLEKAITTADDAARVKLLADAQKAARDDGATVNGFIINDVVVATKNVKGYVYDPSHPAIPPFYTMYLE